MNPTVITTGPGVIIATATASRNCLSSNQPYSLTTPPYRNGTMASPLPNTNAPALVKNRNIFNSVSFVASGTPRKPVQIGRIPVAITEAPGRNLGGDLTNQVKMPAARKSKIHSD